MKPSEIKEEILSGPYPDNVKDQVSALVNRIDELEDDLLTECERVTKIITIKNHYFQQMKQYYEALEFYADKENYKTNVVDQWEPIIPVLKDVGKKARQVLEGPSCT